MKSTDPAAVVYFDGFCHLCNGFIDFLLKIDKNKKLKFSPLQGKTFQSLNIQLSSETIIFLLNGKIFYKSQAVIKILSHIGGIWRVASIVLVMPVFIRDFFYDVVANNRYKLFGKKAQCRIPTNEEKERFLD